MISHHLYLAQRETKWSNKSIVLGIIFNFANYDLVSSQNREVYCMWILQLNLLVKKVAQLPTIK